MRVDDLVREGLEEGSRQVRFDPARWTESVAQAPRTPVRVRLPRAPRPARRWVAAVAVAAVLLVGMGVPLALLSGLGGEDQPVRPGGPTLDTYGLQMNLPEGWDGRIVGPAGTEFGPYLHAANFPLPPEDDEVASAARGGLEAGQVVIVLIDETLREGYGSCALAQAGEVLPDQCPRSYPSTTTPIRIGVTDLGGPEGKDPAHAVAWRAFTAAGRNFSLIVEFGTDPPSDLLMEQTNGGLATLEVDMADAPSGYAAHTDVEDGLSVSIPAGWSFSEDPTDPIEPENVLAAGPGPSPRAACAPRSPRSTTSPPTERSSG